MSTEHEQQQQPPPPPPPPPPSRLSVGQSDVTQDGAPRLDGLYDLAGVVARKSESCSRRVYLHGSAQRLLGGGGPAQDVTILHAEKETR